jgi:hypothetical protein
MKYGYCENPSVTSPGNTVRTATAFGKRIEALKGKKDGEVFLDTKLRKTSVIKTDNTYTVTQYNNNLIAQSRSHYGKEKFEYNYRHFI